MTALKAKFLYVYGHHVRYKSVLELAAKTQLIRTLYISTKLSFLTVMYVYNDSNKAPSDQS